MKTLLSALLVASTAHAADTNCEKAEVFAYAYKRATHAWCQTDAAATYMLASLLEAITDGKARFESGAGDLTSVSGFTAIALGGYKLDAGMIHRRDGVKYISVHFTGPDPVVKFYEVTYRVDASVSGEAVAKH